MSMPGGRERPNMNGARAIPLHRLRGDVGEIAMGPGDPGWNAKIPPPEKDASTVEALEELKAQIPSDLVAAGVPNTPAPDAPVTKRVAFYCGRGESFVVAVEEAPDWDMVESWKHDGATVLVIQKVLQALGIKTQDKTGGELNELRRNQESSEKAAEGD